MKNKIDFIYDSAGCIRYGGWRLWPWPQFRMERLPSCDGKTPEPVLREVLAADDPFCLLWRGQIPETVIKEFQRFPFFPPEALAWAQLNPRGFVSVSRTGPFFALLLGSLAEGLAKFEPVECDVETVLATANFPSDPESVRILTKVTATACKPGIIPAMRKALDCPLRRRLLKLAVVIDAGIGELLTLPVRDTRVQRALVSVIREEARNGAI